MSYSNIYVIVLQALFPPGGCFVCQQENEKSTVCQHLWCVGNNQDDHNEIVQYFANHWIGSFNGLDSGQHCLFTILMESRKWKIGRAMIKSE